MRRVHSEFSDEELDSSSQSYGLDRFKSAPGTSNGGGKTSEEDRHRRTIIIEKKNNSYGFTLQSYGIHYKKEQEVEMLTYVDHVEYDGQAYKAGMREGDVILSINGVDMEKADHNRLVAFIKDCDNRMRMVVLFEDCVRKVGLHMRYIQLQNILQTKVAELEGLLQREREILEGKWKTHSLPARKKANQNTEIVQEDDIYPGAMQSELQKSSSNKTNTLPLIRSAQSTENIGKIGHGKGMMVKESFTPNAQVLLSYQYMDPTSRSNLKSSNSSGIDSAGCIVGSQDENMNYYQKYNMMNKSDPSVNSHDHNSSNCSTLSKKQQQTMEIAHANAELDPATHQNQCQYYSSLQENRNGKQESKSKASKSSKGTKHCHQSYYCNPCMGNIRNQDQNQDNVSLDAYDLASPCCDPHQCVPIKRRSRHHQHKEQKAEKTVTCPQQQQTVPHHHHHHHHHQKHKHKHGSTKEERNQRPKSQSNLPSTTVMTSQAVMQAPCTQKIHTRYYDLNSDLTSRCSLHSPHNSTSDIGTTSYCTSLSADTLNDWDDPNTATTSSRKSLVKVPNTRQQQYPVLMTQAQAPQQFVTRLYHHTVQIQPAPDYQYQQNFIQKPKSWDNLTTKAIGGYGFGYGYVEANRSCGGTMKAVAHQEVPNVYQSQAQAQAGLRKSVYQQQHQYSVENYAPPPSQFVQQDLKTTTTTIITTSISAASKSTENLLKNSTADK